MGEIRSGTAPHSMSSAMAAGADTSPLHAQAAAHSSHPRPKSSGEKIHALTSLRFFAALYVVLNHTLWSAIPSLTPTSLAGRVLSLGYLSVGFFFLLSGYILAMVYLRPQRPIGKRSFYAARFARVYPLFFITLIAGTPFLLAARIKQYGMRAALVKTSISFVGHVFMLQAWAPQLRGIDNPNWSLSVETLFYALFPFIGILIWRLTRRQVWLAAACVWVASQILVNLVYNHVPQSVGEVNPILHLGTFALGILLARWQVLRQQSHGPSPSGTAPAVIALALAVVAYAGVVAWEPRPPVAKLADGLLAPVFAALLWAFSNNRSFLSRWLSVPWLVVLGEASYGLYLIHYVAYQLFELKGLDRIPALYPLYLGGCIVLSIASLYLVETPIRKWILKSLQTRPKETMEAASDAQ